MYKLFVRQSLHKPAVPINKVEALYFNDVYPVELHDFYMIHCII